MMLFENSTSVFPDNIIKVEVHSEVTMQSETRSDPSEKMSHAPGFLGALTISKRQFRNSQSSPLPLNIAPIGAMKSHPSTRTGAELIWNQGSPSGPLGAKTNRGR